jgi:hypothetical protein
LPGTLRHVHVTCPRQEAPERWEMHSPTPQIKEVEYPMESMGCKG